jgi:hypothetical protein
VAVKTFLAVQREYGRVPRGKQGVDPCTVRTLAPFLTRGGVSRVLRAGARSTLTLQACGHSKSELGFRYCSVARRETRDPEMGPTVAGYFGEALGRPLAPEGFNPCPPTTLSGFIEFGEAKFRAGASEPERPRRNAGLLGSVVHRPMVFRRNGVAWVAACAWRADAKADDVAALKRATRELDRRLIDGVAELLAGLVHQLRGDRAAEAITNVPCGHSRRPDCLGKQIAQAIAEALGLPFRQIFADRPCSGVSHPKEFAKLPPLRQIADPLASMLLVDDLATSGWHVEESLTALRRLGATASAFVWITGAVT